MAMSEFAYEPLSAPDAFRLLVLEPGSSEDSLQCRMFQATHSRRLDYEALSYTWGSLDENGQPECFIDGNAVPIRRNLYEALRQLRWRHYERVLWIDALCIDQSNVRERNHQVGRMRDIYSQAETVHVWLGTASETSSIAMAWIDALASRNRNGLGLIGRLTEYSPENCRRSQARRWRALLNLLRRPYWRRVWIVQEIVLAEKLRLQCGGDEARWEGLVKLLENRTENRIFEPRAASKTINMVYESLPARIHKLRCMHQLRGCQLQQLLEATRESLCTDPRDRLYGLLGLAADIGDGRFEVDYSTGPTMEAMMGALWKYFVESNKPDQIMQGCQYLRSHLLRSPDTHKDLMMQVASPLGPGPKTKVVGRVIGKIAHLGQPWKGFAEWEEWKSAMAGIPQYSTPSQLEDRHDEFRKMLKSLVKEKGFHKLGLVRRPAFSHLFGVQAQNHTEKATTSGVVCIDTKLEESFENGIFGSEARESRSFWVEWANARLAGRNVVAIVASNGQIGLAPGMADGAGVRVGDELCQFRGSDVTVVCRSIQVSGGPSLRGLRHGPTIVGKAILAKRANKDEDDNDGDLGLLYSSLDNRYPLGENVTTQKGIWEQMDHERAEMTGRERCFFVTSKGLTWLSSW
ncbi:hypothetical protein PG999_000560 [Apiospora kogelbergensis]|uniref:Heterokaryon incompatibility domain-containing protein n=1 Tax=Apiospora kogelbergensis TaxID=1337665 RepID=A0AAW0RBU1_9PEZI